MVITFYFIQYCTEFSCQQARKCSSVFCSFEQQITMKNLETVSKTDLALYCNRILHELCSSNWFISLSLNPLLHRRFLAPILHAISAFEQ